MDECKNGAIHAGARWAWSEGNSRVLGVKVMGKL